MGRDERAFLAGGQRSPGARSVVLAQQEPGSVGRAGTERQSEDLLTLLATQHAGHRLPAGLRQLPERFVYAVLGLLFPHFAARPGPSRDELAADLAEVDRLLEQTLAVPGLPGGREVAQSAISDEFCAKLVVIRESLLDDARAIFEGDPAAVSVDEVILAYPGFFAIATYRIAHELQGSVALFPRLLTEVAHRLTGIDIHPGAQIGGSFAVDHGRGS